MATPQHDFTVRQGNTGTLAARFYSLDEAGDRVPRDFTGAAVVAYFKWRGGTLTKSGAAVAIDAHTVTVTLMPAETAALPPGRSVVYEIEQTLGGVQTTLLAGALIVETGINA